MADSLGRNRQRGSDQNIDPNQVDDSETQPPDEPLVTNDFMGSVTSGRKLDPDGLWFTNQGVVRLVTRSMKGYYEGGWTCWSNTPQHAKEQWWRTFRVVFSRKFLVTLRWPLDFKRGFLSLAWQYLFSDSWNELFRWDPSNAEAVKILFETKCQERLKDNVYKASKKPETVDWMTDEVKAKLMQARQDPKFLEKSQKFSANKLNGPKAGTKHSQGSVSSAEVARRIRQKTGKLPLAADIFSAAHQRKDKSFVDERSKNVWDKYTALKIANPQTSPDELFFEAAGGWSKKGTIYGLGSSASLLYNKPARSSQALQLADTSCTPSLTSQLQNQVQQQQEVIQVQQRQLEEQKKKIEEQDEGKLSNKMLWN